MVFNSLGFSFNLIRFSETWCNYQGEYFGLDGYKLVFLIRTRRKGCGVLMHIHNAISVEQNQQFTLTTEVMV